MTASSKSHLLLTTLLLSIVHAWGAEDIPAALEPIRLQDIRINGFWKQQAKRLTEHWLPHCIRQMEKGGRGQEYVNLEALARVQRGGQADWQYTGLPWSDAYVYNTVEAVCLALAIRPEGDAELARAQSGLRAKLEEWIPTILAAQSADGYIHTFHTLRQQPRYTKVGDHEFYVMGYFLEMGVAHYRMTGGQDRRLYDAAVKCGDHLSATFGPAPKRTWRNGHPGLEYALCRLGRLVNEVEGAGRGEKYILLARHFLDHQHEGGRPDEYNQSDRPAVQLSEARGHAVRGTYFYTAMTDIALQQGDVGYEQAVGRLWANAIHRKHYLTGGVGASHHGEAFAGDYELPNEGYCESCAGCGLTFWADRMHRLHADGHYRDVQERVLYNNILGAVELSGTNFYYQNPLDEKRARYPWHGCPCCVGNIPRALLAIKDLMYSVNPERTELYLSHYVDSEAMLPDIGGTVLGIRQATRYPWDGGVTVTLHPASATRFALKLRIPDWTESELYSATPDLSGRFSVRVNGEPQSLRIERGYIALRGEWKDGDRIELSLPMEIQRVRADARVVANAGRVALQRGPLAYNFESVDLPSGKNLDNLSLAADAVLRAEWDSGLLGGVLTIRGAFSDGTPLQAIPNFTRLNRLPHRESQWVHLANTYDGVTQRVYVNGRLAKSRSPGTLRIADTPLTIGSDPFGQDRHFKGAIAKPAIFDAALDEPSIVRLAAAKSDDVLLGVEAKPAFAGTRYTFDGTGPVVTPDNIGISGNDPWTMSVWVKADAGHTSPDDFGLGVLGWGSSGPNGGNFLYHRPEGEAVFGFYGNDDRVLTGESGITRSVVWIREVPRDLLELTSSSSYLADGFAWAKRTALSKVHPENGGCYQAALPDRGGYCQRDYVHQIDGAALLGLHRESLAMLRQFALHQSEARGWFTLWEINYDGSPMACDYRDDGHFWRNTAGMFDLIHGAYRQYLWTADPVLVEDPVLRGLYSRTVNEFVAAQDRDGNGIVEGRAATGWGIACTYNEMPGIVLAESADSLGTQRRAFEAYAGFLRARGDDIGSDGWTAKAERLQRVFEDTWYDAGVGRYRIGYDHPDRRPVTGFGYETSWFIPYTGLCEPGARATAYLDFIQERFEAKPSPNIEAWTYLPDVFYAWNQNDRGWRYFRHVLDSRSGYPEVSFAVISQIATRILGIEPDAPRRAVSTLGRLPAEVAWAQLDHVRVGANDILVRHEDDNRTTTLVNHAGPELTWEALFPGEHAVLLVEDAPQAATAKALNGARVSGITLQVKPGQRRIVTVPVHSGH